MERIERERAEAQNPIGAQESALISFFVRLYRALGPVLGALVLDFADFATLGPLGLYVGAPIGAGIGWWLSGMFRVGRATRILLAILAGAYCMAPFTNLLPIATVLSALGRFFEDPLPSEEGKDEAPPEPGEITEGI